MSGAYIFFGPPLPCIMCDNDVTDGWKLMLICGHIHRIHTKCYRPYLEKTEDVICCCARRTQPKCGILK